LVCARIRAAGLELARFLAEADLKVAQIDDPNVRLEASADQASQNARRGAARCSRVHLACDLELREAGLIYYVLASSSDLADALGNAERLGRLTNESVELRFRADQTTKIRQALRNRAPLGHSRNGVLAVCAGPHLSTAYK
jgi:Arabinose-binding domain of AraC transcription regulator, N-term